jgi:hypothetical protein
MSPNGVILTAAATGPSWVQFANAVAWPIVVLLGVLVVALSGTLRGWLVEIVRKIRKVSALGVDVELSPEVANQVSEVTNEAFRALRQRVNSETDRLVHVYQINDKRQRLVDEVIRPELLRHGDVPDFRSTVYIEDVLFTETMYQLVDYYPKSPGPRGRTYPVRFGLVGRAWRSREDQLEADVPTDQKRLIREWGMTWEQAADTGHGRRSFASVLIRDETGTQVALVYMDAPAPAAFGATDERMEALGLAVRKGANELGLTGSIVDLTRGLRTKTPLIRTYSDD